MSFFINLEGLPLKKIPGLPPYIKKDPTSVSVISDSFSIDPEKLSQDRCYFFYPKDNCPEHLLSIGLEFLTFTPSMDPQRKTINGHFQLTAVSLVSNDCDFLVCSFPRAFKDVCLRIAQMFHMTVQQDLSKTAFILDQTRGFYACVEFPAANNILAFQKRIFYTPEQFAIEEERLQWVGSFSDSIDID